MLLPLLLQIAADRGWGKFFHDQMKITFPPHAEIELDYMPPDDEHVWITFAMTFGNVPEDSLLIEHECYAGMKRHFDPMWYSIGIGASFEYPLWIYCTRETPHVLKMTNLTGDYVTADSVIWMFEMTRSNFAKFQEFIQGIVDFFGGTRELISYIRLQLLLQLYPEIRDELRRALRAEARRVLREYDVYLRGE